MKFEQFYKQKFQNRNITWLFKNGSLEVKPVFITGKSYIFVVNCYQAVVLMLYNRNAEMTFSEIKEATNIPEPELKDCLKYMCNPKMRIIEKENAKTPEFTPQEKCKIFAAFNNPNVRVSFIPNTSDKVDPSKVQPGQPGGAAGANPLTEERKNILDAVIVRIMKARKTEVYITLT